MAYTPSVSELDSHQGSAALAIGGGGSMAGNLPLTELFDENTINRLAQVTDTYVANKNKERDEFVKRVAIAKQNASKTEGVYSGDLADINKSKRELYEMIDKKPYLFTPDAPIKYGKEYQEFLDLENQYMNKVDISKSSGVLDKEYRKTLSDPRYNNEINLKRYEQWKQQPIGERTPFFPVANPTNDINKITKNLTAYKTYGTPTVTPIVGQEGYSAINQPFTVDQDVLLADLVEYGDYFGTQYDEILTPEQKQGISRQEYIDKQLLHGVPKEGFEKPQIRQDVVQAQGFREEMQQNIFTQQDERDEQRRIEDEAKREQDRIDNIKKEREKIVNNPNFALPKQAESEVEIISKSTGNKVSYKGVEVFDVTEKASELPLIKEWLGNDHLYSKNGKYWRLNKTKTSLVETLTPETLISGALEEQGGSAKEHYAQYKEALRMIDNDVVSPNDAPNYPIGTYKSDFDGVDPKDIPLNGNGKPAKRHKKDNTKVNEFRKKHGLPPL